LQASPAAQRRPKPWCNQTLAVVAAHPDDAHRPMEKHHDLAAILCHAETRKVMNDYTIRFAAKVYQIAREDIRTGMRGANVRVKAAVTARRPTLREPDI
jgi:hypothetical protein